MRLTREFLEERSIPEPNTGCWLWMHGIGGPGYGMIWDGKKTSTAHRSMFAAVNGPIPPKMDVCHRCDNRACINPDHLFLGTRADNVRDMDRKGRRKNTTILTPTQVRDIRAAAARGERTMDLAARYGVSEPTISSIKSRTNWKHLEDA
jgi:hypothetical protein